MRQDQHRSHRRRDRRDLHRPHACCGSTDQDDLVAIFFRRDLAAIDIVKRIDREGGAPIAIIVEKTVHLHRAIRCNFLIAQAHSLAQIHLDIFGVEIETLRGQHQRQRRIVLVVITDHQRFGAHCAIDIGDAVQVAQSPCLAT